MQSKATLAKLCVCVRCEREKCGVHFHFLPQKYSTLFHWPTQYRTVDNGFWGFPFSLSLSLFSSTRFTIKQNYTQESTPSWYLWVIVRRQIFIIKQEEEEIFLKITSRFHFWLAKVTKVSKCEYNQQLSLSLRGSFLYVHILMAFIIIINNIEKFNT